MKSVLEKLGIQPVNAGACIGPDGWLKDPKGKELVSYNPTTGEAIASRGPGHARDLREGRRDRPADLSDLAQGSGAQRGQVVRDLGDALRELKEPLGELVTHGDGQDPRRRPRRGAGDDRYLRFRRRASRACSTV